MKRAQDRDENAESNASRKPEGFFDVPKNVVRRAVAGDHEAFEILLRQLDPELRRLAFRLVGQSVNDALQEAYLRAFIALPSFRPTEGSIRVWLHRIVYHTCIDHHRWALRHPVQADPGRIDLQPSHRPADEFDMRDDLRHILARISPQKRAALVLVDILDFEYADAGRILGIPEGTVASRLCNARREVREALLADRKEGEREIAEDR